MNTIDKIYKALVGLVADVKGKPNDTRYATHIKIAEEAIAEWQSQQEQPTVNMIVGEDMICPVTKEHCDDECCPVGAHCNLDNDGLISDCEQPTPTDSEIEQPKEIKNIPEKIWLVLGDEDGEVDDFDELDGEFVCWAETKINDTDIPYTRVKPTLTDEQIEQMAQQEAENKFYKVEGNWNQPFIVVGFIDGFLTGAKAILNYKP